MIVDLERPCRVVAGAILIYDERAPDFGARPIATVARRMRWPGNAVAPAWWLPDALKGTVVEPVSLTPDELDADVAALEFQALMRSHAEDRVRQAARWIGCGRLHSQTAAALNLRRETVSHASTKLGIPSGRKRNP